MSQKKSILDALPKNQLFILGALVSFFAITSIGFFVLLSKQLSSGNIVQVGATGTTAEKEVGAPAAQPTNSNIVIAPVTDDDWYKGNKNAQVTIVEFSDPECPFCKRFHDTMNQVIETYSDSVKWVYRHAPLDSLHRKARREAMALECAGDLAGNEGFWNYADALYEKTPSNDRLPDSELFTIAKDTGINVTTFTDCLESEKFAANVQTDLTDAENAGLRGTPYSVLLIGDQKIPISGAQPFEQIVQIIQSVLQ